ncbi:MAG: beta-galactosidase [Lachnospiraceae bacterium]|nr:beta-galactosidase [Lachnospiraceae bacterium]
MVKKLFPQVDGFVHGGDYNPEQWLDRPDILEEDVRMMKKAGVNCVTLGVFSWAVYEPEEGQFTFDWLEEIVDRLYENGIYFILATPSGARPAWLDEKYPEAMRVSDRGVRNHHGVRHNHCMTSPIYREKVAILDRKLSEKFGHHPGFLMFHISNEFGGECYCDACAEKFRGFVKEMFHGDVRALNHAWWTTFWSHCYQSFDQVEPPYANGERSVMGLNLAWRRFTSANTIDFMKAEINAVREATPEAMVTTNFMWLFGGLDYHEMAKELDVISWDSYPRFGNDSESFAETMGDTAFEHSLMRSMKKDRPFMLMESTPSLVNWHDYNKLKRPGMHRISCLQAVACGSDTVQYFQWRKGRGAFEQYHGAVIDHLGTDDTRVFREVREVSDDLEKIKGALGSLPKNRVAILFDWDNRWAINDMMGLSKHTKNYETTCVNLYKDLLSLGVDADVIPVTEDLGVYDLVFAPMLYLLKPGMADRLKAYVSQGGRLVATYLTGYVDEQTLCYLGGFPGDGLSELFGVISEEIDTLYPKDRNGMRFADGSVWEVQDYAEILRLQDAKVLASYTGDFYKDQPALTVKDYGKGKAYYVAARGSRAQQTIYLKKLLAACQIPMQELPDGVEYHERYLGDTCYAFYLNVSDQEVFIPHIEGENLINGSSIYGTMRLAPFEAGVLCK